MKSACYFFLVLLFSLPVYAQTIGTFSSVQPAVQTQNLVLPSSHTFQRITRTGNALSSGETVGGNIDFTGYVPIAGSSTNGYLSLSNETAFAGVSILNLSLNSSSRLWNVTSGGNVPFPFADIGLVRAFCAGTVTPNNHIMVCEETPSTGDGNGDGYNDDGWIIEIDPATRTVINHDGTGGVDKLWAMGRQSHEDVVIKPDLSVAYWSADNGTNGFVYKFVPTVAGNFSAGQLFVLKTTASLGTGSWEQIANTTQADRNNTITLSNTAGAYNFNRVEGIEIGPDGKLYFATTTTGNIYRFRDLGNSVDGLEIFVTSTNYDVDGTGPYPPVAWGSGADNLAFDGEGNLWVQQDGGDNYIWVVAPDHTAAAPKVRLFGIVPAGGEPTGITFSPDYKYLFMSVQHPASGNSTSQTDAAGNAVVFNESTAIVIARKENLGSAALPVSLLSFTANATGHGVALQWKTAMASDDEFVLERAAEGQTFTTIAQFDGKQTSVDFIDDRLPFARLLQYRLKQTDKSGKLQYSETRTVKLTSQKLRLKAAPASNNLVIELSIPPSQPVLLRVVNAAGVVMQQSNYKPSVAINVSIAGLAAGAYYAVVTVGEETLTLPFVKR